MPVDFDTRTGYTGPGLKEAFSSLVSCILSSEQGYRMSTSAPISKDAVARWAEQQHWLTPASEQALQETIKASFKPFGASADKVRSVLHGDWLHEPLHVVMTDVPVGSWTAAVVFDAIAAVSGSRRVDYAADACVLLGLAGAVGAAVTGANDWAEIDDAAPRRIGAVHALLNVVATGLFAWSALSRRKAATRTRARSVAALGCALVAVSAHLGGNLIYEHGIGVEASKPWSKAVPPNS